VSPSRAIRVLVADEQALFRKGLVVVLADEPDMEVVGEARDGWEAVSATEQLSPDVVIMDLRMPGQDGVRATQEIHRVAPSCKVVLLSPSDEEKDLYEAVKAGVNSYLLKEIRAEEVAGAVRAVVAGQGLIAPSMVPKLFCRFAALARQVEQTGDQLPAPVLTARELQVLVLVARGKSNRQIAAELYIAENTVKNHVRNILEKLHVHSRTEAVLHAVRQHLLDPAGD
jgi:DNA-binding NarL/FixJ family response regulator